MAYNSGVQMQMRLVLCYGWHNQSVKRPGCKLFYVFYYSVQMRNKVINFEPLPLLQYHDICAYQRVLHKVYEIERVHRGDCVSDTVRMLYLRNVIVFRSNLALGSRINVVWKIQFLFLSVQ